MQRNIATDGNLLVDSGDPTRAVEVSLPGCVIASPSYPNYNNSLPPIRWDYVFNWTRDAAITVAEILSNSPTLVPQTVAVLTITDYVTFANICQTAGGNLGQANYTVRGAATGAADEGDGPALRILTILQGYALLDPATQATAQEVIARDLEYVLGEYQQTTKTLWEDTTGYSVFSRAAQYRCLNQVISQGPGLGIAVPAGAAAAAAWLQGQLPQHWIGAQPGGAPQNLYRAVIDAVRDPDDPPAAIDPAIDPVMACIYGDGFDCTDPQLLSTAAQVRAQWTPGGRSVYGINIADAGIRGPLLGRYAGDQYDGDNLTAPGGHPWAVCTCTFAELYYCLANQISRGAPVPAGSLVEDFFNQILVSPGDLPATIVEALRGAGDAMLNAVIYHSDHLQLSEQFDAINGYEKSVANLTWSYAALLSAIRVGKGQTHYP